MYDNQGATSAVNYTSDIRRSRYQSASVNEIVEDEEKQRKSQEDGSNYKMPDTSSIMKNASNMTGNMPKF